MTEQPAVFTLKQGTLPLLISIPHAGTYIPDDIAETMTPDARFVDDCDWHLERLYGFAAQLGASILVPSHARYVVDLNRPPDDENLYPGQDTTGLVPVDTFDKAPLYRADTLPGSDEIMRRRDRYWRPYHDALQREIARLKGEHGRVLVWEAHSIRSHVPRFFEGRLPDFNFGTSSGASAAPGLAEALAACVHAHGGYTAVANGRFKGGYITRHYGVPASGVEAVQLELSQITYMDETRPYAYDDARAAQVVPLLRTLVETALAHRG
ncbi:TPA: N-formylglutamate deformylase [Burkholderia vietnamiensis]|uniref:N-formylglutamate deformylase n=1 Tax=Burkholderia TaxID=32008 RepID=UPI00025F06E7|nr:MULTISPECIES: N-formylglutamate deformylase [Burkholderia]AFJ86314.1 N-formylglutamate deformylase [Burkholderia sp. KJ006]KVS24575.1 N-formylglutamate deformylase [Burkholderia vietnamiensis]MBR8007822.1 N-formylglutamate deformylase [Burkholderia vietnamiensis]MBR8015708.1 N-formylglutamate deformylase [Burkholderia vietnamiensis]MBR8206085.1 N-formylglutamate deformylase [Burkholderia vietnamiensis]